MLTTFLLLLVTLISCRRTGAEADDVAVTDTLYNGDELTERAWDWADSVMETMTDEEMIGEVLMPAMYARSTPADLTRLTDYITRYKVGGIVLLKGDVRSVAVMADTIKRLSDRGVFLAIDAENGLRMRLSDAPEFPWNSEIGSRADDQLMYEFGREIARECRAVGISMVLGPVMDVVPGEESHGISRRRSLGSDPHRVADLAIAYARGLEDGRVISVAKHFPGHGSASADSHKGLGIISGDAVRLDSVDLYPFRRYSDELLSAVMVGHLASESLDTVSRPAVVSPVLMQDVLRSRLGFGGLVLTDALNMEGAMGVSAWQAIMAGADIVLAPTDTPVEIERAREALADGRLSREVLANRVRRILFYKYLSGLSTIEPIDIEGAVIEVNRVRTEFRDTINSVFRYPNRNSSRSEP
ncbi:MAG: hypothetical protein K2H86_00850 [Muribaculaceae bacterium]|nr:hypothetical protein [Muribaculaceae bacterium]